MLLIFPLLTLMGSCKKSEDVKLDLVEDYSLSGGRKSATYYGSYTVYKDGKRVGQLELADNRIQFVTFDADGRISGELTSPVGKPSDAGSSATIIVTGSEGHRESHQMIELRIVGGELDPKLEELKGSVVHGGPYEE